MSGDLQTFHQDGITMEKINQNTSFDGRFMGYGNDPAAVMLVYIEE